MNPLKRSMGPACTAIPSLKTVVEALERWASKSVAESWDNVGLLVEPQTSIVLKTVLLTNDLTENVAEEAIRHNANLIISYHPPIFKGLMSITQNSWKVIFLSKT